MGMQGTILAGLITVAVPGLAQATTCAEAASLVREGQLCLDANGDEHEMNDVKSIAHDFAECTRRSRIASHKGLQSRLRRECVHRRSGPFKQVIT